MSRFTQLQDKVDSVLAQYDREVEKDRDWIFELNAYKKGGGLLNNAFANDAMMKVYVEIGEDLGCRRYQFDLAGSKSTGGRTVDR